jgi:outer membrane receptor protein involved in Fe transport
MNAVSKLGLVSEDAKFRTTVRNALIASLAAVPGAALAQEPAPAPAPTGGESTELETIEVTGSRIRRVDVETASPIFTIDRSTIIGSGVQTVGELVQELPSISGAGTNPRVNNGGGSGAAVVSLRGLGEGRTLVLLNGRRLVSNAEGVDLNQIPINLIERVEVLKEGASAIYGSDAIGGVVNLITRTDYNSGEIMAETGTSGESDGDRKALNLSWGATTGRANIMVGINYHDQQEISAGARDFSKDALYLYGGFVSVAGSGRTTTGRFFLEDTDPGTPGVQDEYGGIFNCASVTRNVGAAGDTVDLANYHCFGFADTYNYQPFNLVLTPQERASLFTVGNYKISDSLDGYAEIFYNSQRSGFTIAPLPLDTRPDNVVISDQNIYNPFGNSYGGADAVNQNATFRLEVLGTRFSRVETGTGQINLGLKGDIGDTLWRWDAGVSYGRSTQTANVNGYLFTPEFQKAVGPSFDALDNDPNADGDGDGNPIDQPTCGTMANPIPGCTPINIFNLDAAIADPDQAAQFAASSGGYAIITTRDQRILTANAGGPVFKMPAGDMQLAVGLEHREQRLGNDVDYLVKGAGDAGLICQFAQETCTNVTAGSIEVDEFYAEAFVPILADMPGVEALNLTIGTRLSDYDRFGNTTNSKLGIEYRPVDNVLARLSFAQVFRAPTITDLFLGATANAPQFADPCEGFTGVATPEFPFLPDVCENVATDGSFVSDQGQVTGRFIGNSLPTNAGGQKPEEGEVLTYGVVFQATQDLSLNIDFWSYDLEDTIEFLDVGTIADACGGASNASASFRAAACDLINRFSDGQVRFIDQPAFNLGTAEASGFDVGVKYNLPETAFGRFRLGLDATNFGSFKRNGNELAGEYDRQDGNFAEWRAQGMVDWNFMNWNALFMPRWISSLDVENADGAIPGVTLQIPSVLYLDVSVAYTIPGFNTQVRLGVDNLTDEQPPLFYGNNVLNGNVDVETYDTIGQFMWLKVSQTF